MVKAQVFISCGQLTSKEKEIGTAIVDYFQKRGFEPYFAEDVHSPLGLTQSVYANLKKSEYFVCINPKRENSDVGSLFVQQELALASFLELPLIAFHQTGVSLQGVAKYLHVNSIEFSTLAELLERLEEQAALWDPESKNQIRLSWGKASLNVSILDQQNQLSNWYHITAENLSSTFHAKNSYCYIESMKDVTSDRLIFGKHEYINELMWAGTGRIIVDIPRQAKRDIDAIYTVQGSCIWQFTGLYTSTIYYYRYPSLRAGEYQIMYVVNSDNFPLSRTEFHVVLSKDHLEVIDQKIID